MSGGGDIADGDGGPLDCDIVKETVIQNPDIGVLKNVEVGERLEITMRGASPVVISGGNVAGSLVYSGVGNLIRCMQDGYEYVADVTKIVQGTEWHITIRPN